ncbi:hypothetical protein GQX74_001643 [Glossina fuscipes]|nr:hypothetical protein GQX74_001643 [Glossina fuscipes]
MTKVMQCSRTDSANSKFCIARYFPAADCVEGVSNSASHQLSRRCGVHCAESLIRKELPRIRLRDREELITNFINFGAPIKQLKPRVKPRSHAPTVTAVESLPSDELRPGKSTFIGRRSENSQRHIEKRLRKRLDKPTIENNFKDLQGK